jgi:hypothetical protein
MPTAIIAFRRVLDAVYLFIFAGACASHQNFINVKLARDR